MFNSVKKPFSRFVQQKGRYKPSTKKQPQPSVAATTAKKYLTFRNVMIFAGVMTIVPRVVKAGLNSESDEDFFSKAMKPPKQEAKLVVRRMNDKIADYDGAFLSATKNPKAAALHKMQYNQLKLLDSEFEALNPNQIQQLLAAGQQARKANAEFDKTSKVAKDLLTLQYMKRPDANAPPPLMNPDGTFQPVLPQGAVRKEEVDPVTGLTRVTVEITESKDEILAEQMLAQAVQMKIKNEIMLLKTIELILSSQQKTQLILATTPNLPSMLASRLLKLDSIKRHDFIFDKLHRLQILPTTEAPRVYVVNFKGDTGASQVEKLREEVTGILSVCDKERGDKVVVVLHSGGGTVTGYGLGAAQLNRIKTAGLPLTVCVDEVAASGGYMMAAVADKILASPFAVLGSIGVISTIPNFSNRLAREGIEVEDITAGKYKRTLTPYKKGTAEDRAKMKSDIEEIFGLFKAFLREQRPSLDVEKIATGEVWFGPSALKQGLCDELITSDDYILSLRKQGSEVYSVSLEYPPKAAGLLGLDASAVVSYVTNMVMSFVTSAVQAQLTGDMNNLSSMSDTATHDVSVNERFMAYDASFANGKAPRF